MPCGPRACRSSAVGPPSIDAEVVDLALGLPATGCQRGDDGAPGVLQRLARRTLSRAHFAAPLRTPAPPPVRSLAHTRLSPKMFQLLSNDTVRRVGVFRPIAVRTLELAWTNLATRHPLFPVVDGLMGRVLSTHALHEQFVVGTPAAAA